MRPINLIPTDQRHGQRAPMRTGPLPYLLVGCLVALLAAVTLLVTAENQVSEGKSELTKLEREDAVAEAEAKRLAVYAEFEQVHEQRMSTIASLADSRFDWERVMRELALVLPRDVWLSEISGSASPESGGEAASGGELSAAVVGPSLAISGCAAGQESVAGFVTALKDIDGVTRVGVEESALPAAAEGSVSSGEGESSNCQTREFVAEFNLTVAFDAAPVPVSAGTEEATVSGSAEAMSSEAESGGGAAEGAGGE